MNCEIPGCDYAPDADAADPVESLRGHLRGKAPHDDDHQEAVDAGAPELWTEETTGTTDDQADAEADSETPVADDEMAVAPDEEYEQQWSDEATDQEVREAVESTDAAENVVDDAADDDGGLPVGWLALGAVVVLVVLVLVLSDDAPTDETVHDPDDPDDRIDPAEVDVVADTEAL